MNLERFDHLAALVLEARQADKVALLESQAASLRWKEANAILTDRMKVFDQYVAECKSLAITPETIGD